MAMRKSTLLAVIAVNVAVLIALAFVYPEFMVSPGKLSAGHQALGEDCFACHRPFMGASEARCQNCHKLEDIGVRDTTGKPLVRNSVKSSFHRALLDSDCMACHTVHHSSKLTHSDIRKFSHSMLQADVRKACSSCHVKPADELHRPLTANCSGCHATKAWKPSTFRHSRYFVLDKNHNTDCATCHIGAKGGSGATDFKQYTCYGCHEHSIAKIRAKHLKEGIRDFSNCVKCHRDPQVEPNGKDRPGGREDD